ncbi:MAG TPA: BON domain-containing protein [Candidatus Binatia bacterium]|nr:BON domain-containing protein [Candidatus Binatia bacterium]
MTVSRLTAFVVTGAFGVAAGTAVARTPDAWITAKTKIALLTAEGVHATGINVDTVDGRVTLAGTVPSAAEKAKAEAEARKVSGVTDVRNLVQVVPAAQEKAVAASDAEIRERARAALRDDPALAGSDIDVASVHDGVALLSGTADSASAHLEALDRVRSVSGVRRVASEIQSPDRMADRDLRSREGASAASGAKRTIGGAASDAWITSDTKLRLLADGDVPGTQVNVDTRNGVVTLFGIVPTERAKTAAEADAKKVSGVREVRNLLQVVPTERQEAVNATDADLEKAIERELDAREDLKDATISVEVKDGVARLTGMVASDPQRLEAAMAARGTEGIRAVQDDLRVETRAAR